MPGEQDPSEPHPVGTVELVHVTPGEPTPTVDGEDHLVPPYVLVGSGRRCGKLLVPGKAFAELPGAIVLDGLGVARRHPRGA